MTFHLFLICQLFILILASYNSSLVHPPIPKPMKGIPSVGTSPSRWNSCLAGTQHLCCCQRCCATFMSGTSGVHGGTFFFLGISILPPLFFFKNTLCIYAKKISSLEKNISRFFSELQLADLWKVPRRVWASCARRQWSNFLWATWNLRVEMIAQSCWSCLVARGHCILEDVSHLRFQPKSSVIFEASTCHVHHAAEAIRNLQTFDCINVLWAWWFQHVWNTFLKIGSFLFHICVFIAYIAVNRKISLKTTTYSVSNLVIWFNWCKCNWPRSSTSRAWQSSTSHGPLNKPTKKVCKDLTCIRQTTLKLENRNKLK